jgi:uncharacterized YccA/Bax inhibitor family protein
MKNPIISQFDNISERETVINADSIMTVNGTINIAMLLSVIVLASAGYVWSRFTLGYTDQVQMLIPFGAISGFILALIISFFRVKALIPLYAVAEGLFIGGISAIFESMFPGIVIQAVSGTFAAMFAVLILYRTGLIKYTDKLRSVIYTSINAIVGVYLINFIGSFFGLSVPYLHTSSSLGIGISLFVITIASLSLVTDFHFIKTGEERMFPKEYEWIGAFGLLVTLIWIYIEVLNILARLRER